MGRSKATIELAGRPLISYGIAAARVAGLEPLVVAKPDSELPPLDCPRIPESDERTHPLAGGIAALDHSGAPVVALACDVPLVPPGLLAELAHRQASFAMPAVPRPQPLVARYAPVLLPRLRTALDGGESLIGLAEELGGDRLEAPELKRFGDPRWILANANDPAELASIAAELERRDSG